LQLGEEPSGSEVFETSEWLFLEVAEVPSGNESVWDKLLEDPIAFERKVHEMLGVAH